MIDLPPGDWSSILVGAWWPSAVASDSSMNASANRSAVRDAYDGYEHVLFQARSGPLAGQKGHAAQAATDMFEKGEHYAKEVQNKSGIKASAYQSSAHALESLRSGLSQIAAEGNQKIDKIIASKGRFDKPLAIAEVILEKNRESARKSDEWSSDVKKAIGNVLAADGDTRTVDDFVKSAGMAKTPVLPSREDLIKQVESALKNPQIAGGMGKEASDDTMSSLARDTASLDAQSGAVGSRGEQRPDPTAGSSGHANPVGAPTGQEPSKLVMSDVKQSTVNNDVGRGSPDGTQIGQPVAMPLAGAPTPGSITSAGGASGALSGAGNLSGAAGGGSPSLPSAGSLGGGSQPLSPDSLAQSFTSGMQAGAPASAGAEALSQSISDTVQSQAPQHNTPPPISPPTTASGGFAFEAPQHYSEPPAPAPATEAQHQPMYAAPVAPAPAAAAPMMAPPPAAAAGPLPTYGSDLRPATAAAPPPPVAGAAPMSAPVNPASGTAAGTQPAVVRQQSTSAATAPPTGLVENALTAAATGATAGVASEQAIANARLQRLLEAVARQEPKLAWAIGDREDGTTILVTDLASGWIPPHVEIPTGVQVLTPTKRRGNVEHLLGDTTNFAIWTPGHYLPPAKDVDPVQMSFRARKVPDIDELNWEITQATNWRDGLPRLAHTLTKAGIAGTGVLETEADLLYEHLTLTRDRVVKSYPNDVDATDIGNWQLLAAIGGLIAKDSTTLKYHFAWFQALSMATQGGTR